MFHSTIKVVYNLDNERITSVDDNVFELLGFSASELVQHTISSTILPNFDPEHSFFGARTKFNANFPVMIKRVAEKNMIRITSMPTLSGYITVGRNQRIQSYNASFVKYLFGYGHDLINTNVAVLIPVFTALIACLEHDQLLFHDFTLNSHICLKILRSYENNASITAQHRDGTLFNIDLQIKLQEDNNYGLWLTFDRESEFAQCGHTTTIVSSYDTFSNSSNIIRSKSISIPIHNPQQHRTALLEKKKSSTSNSQPLLINTATKIVADPSVAPAKIVSFSRPSFSSSITETTTKRCTWPMATKSGDYSAQTLKTNIKDYEIVDELGQGAYGLVKLAYLKSDLQKVRLYFHMPKIKVSF